MAYEWLFSTPFKENSRKETEKLIKNKKIQKINNSYSLFFPTVTPRRERKRDRGGRAENTRQRKALRLRCGWCTQWPSNFYAISLFVFVSHPWVQSPILENASERSSSDRDNSRDRGSRRGRGTQQQQTTTTTIGVRLTQILMPP